MILSHIEMLEKVEVSVEELVDHEEDQEVGWKKAG